MYIWNGPTHLCQCIIITSVVILILFSLPHPRLQGRTKKEEDAEATPAALPQAAGGVAGAAGASGGATPGAAAAAAADAEKVGYVLITSSEGFKGGRARWPLNFPPEN